MEEGTRSPSFSRSASGEQAPVDQIRHKVKVEPVAVILHATGSMHEFFNAACW